MRSNTAAISDMGEVTEEGTVQAMAASVTAVFPAAVMAMAEVAVTAEISCPFACEFGKFRFNGKAGLNLG